MGVGGQHHALATLPIKDQLPIIKEDGAPQGRSGWVQNILPPLVYAPRTVQLAASCYTDCALPAN